MFFSHTLYQKQRKKTKRHQEEAPPKKKQKTIVTQEVPKISEEAAAKDNTPSSEPTDVLSNIDIELPDILPDNFWDEWLNLLEQDPENAYYTLFN